MKVWESVQEITGTKTIKVKARTYNEALSKIQNREYDPADCEVVMDADHLLSLTELLD